MNIIINVNGYTKGSSLELLLKKIGTVLDNCTFESSLKFENKHGEKLKVKFFDEVADTGREELVSTVGSCSKEVSLLKEEMEKVVEFIKKGYTVDQVIKSMRFRMGFGFTTEHISLVKKIYGNHKLKEVALKRKKRKVDNKSLAITYKDENPDEV